MKCLIQCHQPVYMSLGLDETATFVAKVRAQLFNGAGCERVHSQDLELGFREESGF